MRISSASSPVSSAASGLRASSIARSGRPTPRSQSAISGKQRRLAAHPARRAQFGERLRPVAAVVGGDSDGFADRGDPARARACGPGVRQRGFGILVEEFTGRDQMPRDRVGGASVQCCEFAADLGRQLLGLDLGGDRRAVARPGRLSPSGCSAGPRRARFGPDERGGERRGPPPLGCRRSRPGPRMPFYPYRYGATIEEFD